MQHIPRIKLVYWKAKEINGVAPIAVVATLRGKRKYFATGVKIEEKYFKKGEIDKKYPNAAYMNQILKVRVNEVEGSYLKMAATGVNIELNQEKKTESNPKFYNVGIACFKALENKCKPHYLKRCVSVLEEFKLFAGDVAVNQISVGLLQQFEASLYERQIGGNTINRRFKWLKQVANHCDKYFNAPIKAFDLFKFTGYVQPLREYLTPEQVAKIEALEIYDKIVRNVRDAFIIGCNTGLRFSDLQLFDYKKNVVESDGQKRIILTTKKTGEIVSVAIKDRIDNLLKKLKPLPTNAYTNRILKEISEMAGVPEISFHQSRNTFATTLLNRGASIESVSKLLGHSNIKTTQIYAQITNLSLDKAMDLLT